MAKRYGRNQRRRHREMIDGLEAKIETMNLAFEKESGLRAELSGKLDALRTLVAQWDADVRQLLGAYSAFRLRPGSIKSNAPFMRVPIEHDGFSLSLGFSDVAVQEAPLSVQALKRLVIVDRTDRQRLRHLIRLIVERPNGTEEVHFAYEVDGMELMSLGVRDVPLIAKRIAEGLYHSVREVRRG